MADETINIRIRLREAAKFAVETRKAKREIDQLGDAAAKADRKARGTSNSMNILQRSLKVFNPLALVGGSRLALLGAGAALSVPSIIALSGALAPLVGLLGTIPAFAMLAGQGLGVAVLGLHGVADAVGGLNGQLDPKKFALLSRPAQDFALTLDALKPRILSLQRSVQRGMFPGLTEGLHAASPAIAQLQGPLAGTGREIGRFGAGLGKLVGSRGFLADLRSQAQFNNVQIRRLGGGGLHLVNVFRNLTVGSRGLVSWLVRLVAGWTASADRMTAAGRASGGLQRGFHGIQVTTSRVGKLLWALASAFFHIGVVGRAAVGGGLLLALMHGAQALDRWTQSAHGVDGLTRAFQGSHHVLMQVAAFAATIATGVGPHLADTIKNIVAAIQPLITGGGGGAVAGLNLYVGAFNLLAQAVLALERNVPGATTVLSALLALMLVNSKLQVIGFAKDGIGLLTKGMRYLAVATKAATAAEVAQMGVFATGKTLMAAFTGTTVGIRLGLAALAVQETITGATATVMWAAITGPVGLVVLAIAAVIGGAVLLYNKWGWFHRAVDNTFGFIKDHWPLILGVLTGPIGLAVAFIVTNFGRIKRAAQTVFGFIAHLWNSTIGKIHFKAPGWMPGIGGHSFGVPNIPGYANGTAFHPGGLALVGERGPEILSLPRAARVDPLPSPTLSAPRMATVRRSGGNGSSGGREPIHVHVHSTLKVDRRTLAKATSEAIADEKAGG